MQFWIRLCLMAFVVGVGMVESGCKSRKAGKGGNTLPSAGSIIPEDFGMSVDAEGRLLDSMGRLVLDANGNPVYANDVTVDANGNLIGPDGSILTDADGNPIGWIGGAIPERQMGREIMQDQFQQVFFPYDSNHIIPSERSKVEQVADYLRRDARASVIIEGHCDERGSRDYNLALGERRALSVREYLISLGIDGSRIQTNSYGEEKPAAMGHGEQAWSQNRRAVFMLFQ